MNIQEQIRWLREGVAGGHAITIADTMEALLKENERLAAALREIGETAGHTLLGCSHEDCDVFPYCSEEGMRGHERGANRAFEQCAGIANEALKAPEVPESIVLTQHTDDRLTTTS